ncbi:chromate transporter [mine drainage metagenome]|uniref:Chromate transporter n=1 Tax=mine drainage metagenome TaxID=410659 RepID=T1D4G2_9ZZZZ
MKKKQSKLLILGLALEIALPFALWPSQAIAADSTYPHMAPLHQYLMPESSEIALARSAAPRAISAQATVMVLTRHGYSTAVNGRNGFLCIVERSWGHATINRAFWNPKMRAPICFNPSAAKSFAPIYFLKTNLVLADKSRVAIARALASAFHRRALPALEPGAMCYMMSKEQYLGDRVKNWHPHLMFFVSGSATRSWGANLPGSPVIALNDPEERATIFLVLVNHWSDGTPAP